MAFSDLTRISKLLVMPESGMAPVLELIGAAATSIRVKMFTFDSTALIEALCTARARGVAVQVMLNPQRSSGTRANDSTMDRLREGGVDVAWTNPAFAITHEKTAVVDDRVALVATFNFMDKYFTCTRDYGLVIDDAATVRLIAACFDADWQRQEFALPDHTPVALSSGNSRAVMAAVIDGARDTLRVHHPKFSDMAILDRLLQAKARGVHVHVLCAGHHGISDSDKLDTFSALRSLQSVGVRIRRQHKLRLHAKLLIADSKRGMIGSMNIDRSAFDLRRELGIVFNDPAALAALGWQFRRDWRDAKHFDPPDPLMPPQTDPPSEESPSEDPIGPDPAYQID